MESAIWLSHEGQLRITKQTEKENEQLARNIEESTEKGNRKKMRFQESRGGKRGDPDGSRDQEDNKRGRSQTASASSSTSLSSPGNVSIGGARADPSGAGSGTSLA